MTGLVEGKIAIVTGGAKGLGHGISRAMAKEGAHLLITGREGAATEAVAAEIRTEFGTRAIGMSADMGIKEQVEALVQRAVDEYGGIDTLVTNASSLSANVLLEHKTDEMLDCLCRAREIIEEHAREGLSSHVPIEQHDRYAAGLHIG